MCDVSLYHNCHNLFKNRLEFINNESFLEKGKAAESRYDEISPHGGATVKKRDGL